MKPRALVIGGEIRPVPEIIELCVRWYITYRLSYRDLLAMMAERGARLTEANRDRSRVSTRFCRVNTARGIYAQPVIMIRKAGTHIAMVPAQHNTTAAVLTNASHMFSRTLLISISSTIRVVHVDRPAKHVQRRRRRCEPHRGVLRRLPAAVHGSGRSAAAQGVALGTMFVALAAVTDSAYALAASSVAPALARTNWPRASGRYLD